MVRLRCRIVFVFQSDEPFVDIVKKVERGDLKQDPSHITDLRLN